MAYQLKKWQRNRWLIFVIDDLQQDMPKSCSLHSSVVCCFLKILIIAVPNHDDWQNLGCLLTLWNECASNWHWQQQKANTVYMIILIRK